MKSYTIAGQEFTLLPLSLRQKRLAYPVEKRIREIHVELAKLEGTEAPIDRVLSLANEADEILLSEDFPQFLAAILTPKGKAWDAGKLDELVPVMEQIDEETQAEVLQDFFARNLSSISGLKLSLNLLSIETGKSPGSSSASPKDGTAPSGSPSS